MSPRILDCEQRSLDWFAARAGRLTGSVAADVQGMTKAGKETAARRDLRLQLAIERITNMPVDADSYVSKEMQRGIDLEPAARARYEAVTGEIVRTTGFVYLDDLLIGCSLDGDVANLRGIIELKCPKSATHVAYLKERRLPLDYVPQVCHNVWVTGADWCDFISFDDRLPEDLQFFMVRVTRDQLPLTEYIAAARQFLAEVETEVEALQALRAAA